jgi:hypothetical protein
MHVVQHEHALLHLCCCSSCPTPAALSAAQARALQLPLLQHLSVKQQQHHQRLLYLLLL